MKYSTGRNARMRHSTATKEDRAKRRKDRHPRPQHSTGRKSTLSHSTGMGADMTDDEEDARTESEQAAFEEATERKPPVST